MIDLIFVLLLFTGCGCWLTGVVSVLTGDGLTPMNLFLILVGGQLTKLGWTDVLVQNMTRKYSELMKALQDRLKW